MKITLFDNVPPGGAARVVCEHAIYLDAIGHEVTWFTSAHEKMMTLPTSVRLIHHDLNSTYKAGQTIFTRAHWLHTQLKNAYQELYEYITSIQPDVILVHPCKHTQAPYLLRMSKIPTVYFIEEPLRVVSEPELHTLDHLGITSRWAAIFERALLKQIDQKNTQKASCRLTHSEFCAKSIQRYYNASVKPIGLGVDCNIFKKSAKTNNQTPYFLFVGEKNELNGYTFLQKAILRKRFKVVYVSSQNGTLPLSDKQLAKLYSRATATLCLARKEPFGLVALESMACSTPVIALSEGGYKETILPEKTGLLIKRHPKSLASAIDKMMDPVFHAYVSRRCRAHVAKNFTWQAHGKRLDESLKQANDQVSRRRL